MSPRALVRAGALVLGCVSAPAPAVAGGPAPCETPGHVIRWQASYCMYLSETDDLEAGTVQACLAQFTFPGYEGATSECERKAAIRRELCRLRIAAGTMTGDVAGCARSEASIPGFVRGEDEAHHDDAGS